MPLEVFAHIKILFAGYPLVVNLHEHGSDQADCRFPVRENPDNSFTTSNLTSEYGQKIYDTFIPLGKDAFEFVSYTMKVLTFILAAFFWSVLMCTRLYVKSLLNGEANSKHAENQKKLKR